MGIKSDKVPKEIMALKDKVLAASKKHGARTVCSALVAKGLSPRQSDLLTQGDHKGKFRRKTVDVVLAVLAEFQFKQAS